MMNHNKRLNKIFGALAFGILIVATWLTFSGHPLATQVNRWQMKQMQNSHDYFPVLTIFVLALPPLLVLLVSKFLILKGSGKSRP